MSDHPRLVHLITAGLSLLDKTHGPDSGLEKLKLDEGMIEALRENRTVLYDEEDDNNTRAADYTKRSWEEINALLGAPHGGTNPDHELSAALQELSLRDWPHTMSAELNSLAAYYRSTSPRLRKEDTAVLITSDTAAGLRASLLNALVMTGGDTERVRYLSDTSLDVDQARGMVVVLRLTGLATPSGPDEAAPLFHNAMRTLGALGRNLYQTAKAEPTRFRFHLSGGFKAALPYLLNLAEAMRTVCGRKVVSAHSLHESAFDQQSLPIPLRSLDLDLRRLREDLVGADGTLPAIPGGDPTLNGFLYEETPQGKVALTPFGTALRELVREIPEPEA
ncbi:CRISPR-associated protein Csm6 family [Nocardiopsis sp. Huas11]|uniref:hypothetical protein n=1 Tax=Nocardiopsis sp. Huas11 TaxID=2183912 RepID=UPI000EB11C0D|nr:hypothetical protein [Nocardiopsis sp. Huas11]RKS07012.1 CRISPR-associated protein Csm6 family [Nocardiopsis sp. Huas11]